MTLPALLQRFAADPTERVKEVERFIEEHGDPRFREDAWFPPDEPLLGFVVVPAGPFSMGSDQERDFRRYDDETPQHEVTLPAYANYDDAHINRTTVVGCFPGGVSPFGVEEVSGNVLEWTRSVYKGYPYKPTDGREDLTGPGDALRVLRGGAFDFTKRFVRAAVRSGGSPRVRSRDVGFRVVVSPFSS